jgi:hypothetical protein
MDRSVTVGHKLITIKRVFIFYLKEKRTRVGGKKRRAGGIVTLVVQITGAGANNNCNERVVNNSVNIKRKRRKNHPTRLNDWKQGRRPQYLCPLR